MRWSLPDGRALEVDATFGKPFDVLGVKGTSLDEIRSYATHLAREAARLYASEAPRRELRECPCCGTDTAGAPEALRVYGVAYHRCLCCGHAFIRSQPAEEVLLASFAETEELAATYTDRDAAEARLREIVAPKLDWLLGVHRDAYGIEPRSVADVGAGGGHFVAACRRAGIEATGHELSAASRAFAADAFDVDLLAEDFLVRDGGPVDVVTFWGLLEYTPEPRRFLEAARARLTPRAGLLVVEVPRFDCLGTAVQRAHPALVARHLDPTSHVNCFSDTSLAAALDASGFRPVAAWYFGMDAYELLVQLALRLEDGALDSLAEPILALQPALDAAGFCDDIVVAAVRSE